VALCPERLRTAVVSRPCSVARYTLLARINAYLMRWSRNKYRRLRGRKAAQAQWDQAVKLRPRFFAHWAWVNTVPDVW
jgi:RNA-directed DNA polymerase